MSKSSAWKPKTLAGLTTLAAVLACSARDAKPPERAAVIAPTMAAAAAPQPAVGGNPSDVKHPTLLITDPATLAALEQQGLSLGGVFGVVPDSLGQAPTNLELSQLPRFAPLIQELDRDSERALASDKLSGVDVARYSHRAFDRRFLRLPQARFTLVGVVNRPDRAAFNPESCGETRLIYRLNYALDAERASKLPMTIGIELEVPRSAASCRDAAKRWLEPPATEPAARASWLRSEAGPLSPSLTVVSRTTARVVVNLQLVRWPSTVRPDLGGHAEYLLRSFRADEGGLLKSEPLENTIDPNEFASAAKRQALLEFLDHNAVSVDAGTPLLPTALLATRALSVTPRGLARLANRPFSAALTAQAFAGRDFASGAFVKSPAGLLRRLDQLSCPGCHQARSVAGFHLLGEDVADAPAENALAVAVSPQVSADLPRRLRVAEQMLAGTPPDFAAPLAERGNADGGYGQACTLGTDASFANWTCPEGLRCSNISANPGDPVGQCLPPEHQVGDACESGSVTQQRDRLRDRMSSVKVESCPSMICNRSGVGFPGGMCTARCGTPGSSCGSIAILDSFNACLARGASFLSCIRGNVQPAGLRACDAENPCRDDYVCARAAHGGVCLPPYFVFQLRVDGHSSSLH